MCIERFDPCLERERLEEQVLTPDWMYKLIKEEFHKEEFHEYTPTGLRVYKDEYKLKKKK